MQSLGTAVSPPSPIWRFRRGVIVLCLNDAAFVPGSKSRRFAIRDDLFRSSRFRGDSFFIRRVEIFV